MGLNTVQVIFHLRVRERKIACALPEDAEGMVIALYGEAFYSPITVVGQPSPASLYRQPAGASIVSRWGE